MLPSSELKSLRDAVSLCGRLPRADDLDNGSIIGAIAHDKKLVSGEIKWVLLNRIGEARMVDGREITPRLLRASLHAGLRQIN